MSITPLAQRSSAIIVNEATLPILSRSRVLNVFAPTLRSQAPLKWSWSYFHPTPTAWLRFRVVLRNVPAGVPFRVVIFDAPEGGRQVGQMTSEDFDQQPGRAGIPSPSQAPMAQSAGPVLEAWTPLVESASARIELYADGDVSRMIAQIERCNFEFQQPAPKAIVGDDDRQDLVRAYGRQHRYYRWSAPIAFLLFQALETKLETNCTAFLVAATLIMTNNHCISVPKQLKTAILQFGFESDPIQQPPRVPLTRIEYTDYGLDVTVLRLGSNPRIAPARLDETRVAASQHLILVQHPNGQPKTISVTGCAVQTPTFVGRKEGTMSDFLHACDSDGGSSGSPVMDESTGAVVGLHHLAFFDPKILDFHNLGVRTGEIMAALRVQAPAIADEIDRAQRGLPSANEHVAGAHPLAWTHQTR